MKEFNQAVSNLMACYSVPVVESVIAVSGVTEDGYNLIVSQTSDGDTIIEVNDGTEYITRVLELGVNALTALSRGMLVQDITDMSLAVTLLRMPNVINF